MLIASSYKNALFDYLTLNDNLKDMRTKISIINKSSFLMQFLHLPKAKRVDCSHNPFYYEADNVLIFLTRFLVKDKSVFSCLTNS